MPKQLKNKFIQIKVTENFKTVVEYYAAQETQGNVSMYITQLILKDIKEKAGK